MTNSLQFALAYAAMGWHVFPVHRVEPDDSCSCGAANCRNVGKHPQTRNGVKDASINPASINAWWGTMYPHANIGVACGKISGILAIDVDPRNGGVNTFKEIFEANIFEYADCGVIATTGGGGKHLIYAYPEGRVNTSKLGLGIDVKKDGGYIVVAPSNHASGMVYEWKDGHNPLNGAAFSPLPDFLRERLEQQASQPTQATTSSTGTYYEVNHLRPDEVKDLRVALAFIDPDDYHTWIKIGMALHSIGTTDQVYDLWDQWSQGSKKYDASEIPQKWSSFKKDKDDRLNRESIFHIAKEHGWENPGILGSLATPPDVVPDLRTKTTIAAPSTLLDVTGALKSICNYMNATSIFQQPIFSLLAGLSLMATVLGNRYATETGLRPNLYLVALGPTGCGKEPQRKAIKEILTQAKLLDRLGGEDIASGQALITRVSISPSVIFLLDEFGLFLQALQDIKGGPHLREIISNFMKLYTSSDSIYVGREYADQRAKPRKEIQYPCASIYGTTTAEELHRALTSGDATSGNLNRFLMMDSQVSFPNPQTPSPRHEVPQAILSWIHAATGQGGGNLEVLNLDPAHPIIARKSEAARKLLADYQLQVRELMRNASDEGVRGVWARAAEMAEKLAMIVAVGDNPIDIEISQGNADWAISAIDWATKSQANRLDRHVSDNRDEAKIKKLIEYVRNARNYAGDRKYKKACKLGFMPHSKLLKLMRVTSQEFLRLHETATARGDIVQFMGNEDQHGLDCTMYCPTSSETYEE
ncbi:MAG: bifunctional DNA primase/polymerase [Magnetococcales bacterium]|nr:bifunctional DNA primase/polymerase [Magnetococcales bacterium]